MEKEIFLQSINGYTGHVHSLISLGKDQTLSKVTRLIKGESSFWINQNNLTSEKFSWQDDYFAVSVSESQVETVKNNQCRLLKDKPHRGLRSVEKKPNVNAVP